MIAWCKFNHALGLVHVKSIGGPVCDVARKFGECSPSTLLGENSVLQKSLLPSQEIEQSMVNLEIVKQVCQIGDLIALGNRFRSNLKYLRKIESTFQEISLRLPKEPLRHRWSQSVEFRIYLWVVYNRGVQHGAYQYVLTRVDSCCFKSQFYRKDLTDELKIFGMSSRHHIDDFIRGRIIGKIEEGRKITDVAREFDIAHSVVSRLWKSFKTTGMCRRRHGGGRVRSTTPAEDRYIVLSVKRNRRTTAQEVANQFLAASGKQISRKTVARRLRGGGLYARRPVVCVPLTRHHRTARLQWCREHHNWTE
ncbi:transposable element Tcb1 transposase [Trichonephila clavipes]|nr:transposable element Tcb1 transposase [Trichonephila clavipes]